MEIIGKELDKYNRGFVTALLFTSKIKGEAVDFLIDTGASRTLIFDLDAENLGIDYSELKRSPNPIRGIGAENVPVYELGYSELVFKQGNSSFVEGLNILVVKHDYTTEIEKKQVMELPSIIGMDMLINYKISYRKTGIKSVVILER